MERIPGSRLKSDVLEQKLGDLIQKFAHIDPLHCAATKVPQTQNVIPHQPTLEPSLMASASLRFERSRSRTREESIPEDAELISRPSTTMSGSVRPNTSRTIVPTTSPPSVSLRSMPSLNLDTDARSEQSERSATVVGSTTPSRDQSVRNYRRGTDREARDREIQAWTVSELSPQKGNQFAYSHDNDSEVDPRLRLSTDNSEAGVFTYMNYSTSPSEDEETSTYMYPLPPQKTPPNRDLPPVPKVSSKSSKSRAGAGQPHNAVDSQPRSVISPPPNQARGPSREEMDMLRKLSRAIPNPRHPARMSSLQPDRTEEQDEEKFYPPTSKYMQTPQGMTPHKVHSDLSLRQRERMYRARAWNPT